MVVFVGALSNLCVRGPKRRVIVDGTKVRCQKRMGAVGEFLAHGGVYPRGLQKYLYWKKKNLHWNVNPPMRLFTVMYGKEWT